MQMDRRTILWVAVAILFIITLLVVFKAGAGGAAVSSTGQAVSAAKTAASSAMVGGC